MNERASATQTELENPALYVNRELAWLAFNGRVLDQARDPAWPLLERLKFLAIFGANLDEFFMIRVSGLHEQLESDLLVSSPDGLSVREQLARIREVVLEQVELANQLLVSELLPALAHAGIRILRWDELSASQIEWARAHFRKAVFPVLTPLAVDPAHPFPFLSNLSLSLGVEVTDPETLELRFARVKVPGTLPRFVSLPGKDAQHGRTDSDKNPSLFIALEDVIAGNLADLFPGMRASASYSLRVTRDMDMDLLEDEAADLLALVDQEVRRRRFGAAVRLEVNANVPEHVRRLLLGRLAIDADDVYESQGLLGLKDLHAIAHLPRADLHDPPFAPHETRELSTGDPFAHIRAHDMLVHHPYESFGSVLHFLRYASSDPNVLAIKMTLYRAGANSEAVRCLMRAAENGKQVAVSIELKARFDEENNIGWARELERAGVHVFYGISGLKTHAKMLLVVRKEASELRRYVHLSTGNYNASTAKLYTDYALFTADAAIGEDASELFNSLSGFSRNCDYRKLIVAPTGLRHTLLSKIEAQAARASAGKPAQIFAKMNSLVDGEIIRSLYRAAQSGVVIDLVVRGICCLRPGLPGVSERIRVRSLLGRFLEHERVYVFGPAGEREFYLASADWMPRNLDRRIEVLFPVTSGRAIERIVDETLAPLDAEHARVYEMSADGSYRLPEDGRASLHDLQRRICNQISKLSDTENLWPPASSPRAAAPL